MAWSIRKKPTLLIAIFLAAVFFGFGLLFYNSDQSRRHQQSVLNKQQEEFAKTATTDPILKYLPYGSIDYNITPTFKEVKGVRTLILEINIILTDADYKQSVKALRATIKQKEQTALDYIRSKGFEPSKYTIQYIVPAH